MTQRPLALIGIDTGGTFTDLVLIDPGSNERFYHKLPTTVDDPARGILEGVTAILALSNRSETDVALLVHGTTLSTNAVLEGKWAATGMLTTRGFRDVLDLARQRRPAFYNLDVPKPRSPAPRDCRFEVTERLSFDGSVVTALDEASVTEAISSLRSKGVEAVAVCFLHAYGNPAHENRAKAMIREAWPEAFVCTSSEVSAEYREYERFATTAVNASLMPVIGRYLDRLSSGLAELGVPVPASIMQSNGGAASISVVREMPITTFLSGPAGGVVGAAGVGQELQLKNLIAFDMGGTSTDVCLIVDGMPAMKSQGVIGGLPASTRTIDIKTIGTGGGSLAWIDPGGLLKVGPSSAGSTPGPAAYGRGGTEPTITDANVVLGRLSPRSLLGGRMSIYYDRAERAVASLADRLGIDTVEAAAGIVEIGNVGMMGAVRVITVEQGHDPRDSVLIAFGGAGPLHAADVARLMQIPRVLVPTRPGLLSAIGLLHADVRGDFSLTRPQRLTEHAAASILAGLKELRGRGDSWLAEQNEQSATAEFSWSADMRYLGQSYELNVPLDEAQDPASMLASLARSFEAQHRSAYGYAIDGHDLELITLRLVATIARPLLPATAIASATKQLVEAVTGNRKVWFSQAGGFTETAIYHRELIPPGQTLHGPAIIEQMDSTTIIAPGDQAYVDLNGTIMITLAGASRDTGE